MNKPKQFLRIDGNSGPGTIQLNRPQAQGCTYNVYGAGGGSPGCSSWAATSTVGDPIHTNEMTCDGTAEMVGDVNCDKCVGTNGYSVTAWFKQGTNELVQTWSADDQRAGTDSGLKHYASWSTTVPDSTFEVQAAWHCTGPSQCTGSTLTSSHMASPAAQKTRTESKAEGRSEGLLTGSLATLGAVAAVALALVAVQRRRRAGAAGTPSPSGTNGGSSFESNPGLLDDETNSNAKASVPVDAANAL
jgi:hypothetical protein